MPSPLLTHAELAEWLRTTPGSGYVMRYRGMEPWTLGFNLGRKLVYRQDDIEAWLQRQSQNHRRERGYTVHTSEESLSKTSPKTYAIWAHHRGICAICLEYVEPMSATIDHIKPRSKGGTNDPSNLQLAHFGCNLRKGNKEAREEWQP